jgi:hypothetical protein
MCNRIEGVKIGLFLSTPRFVQATSGSAPDKVHNSMKMSFSQAHGMEKWSSELLPVGLW